MLIILVPPEENRKALADFGNLLHWVTDLFRYRVFSVRNVPRAVNGQLSSETMQAPDQQSVNVSKPLCSDAIAVYSWASQSSHGACQFVPLPPCLDFVPPRGGTVLSVRGIAQNTLSGLWWGVVLRLAGITMLPALAEIHPSREQFWREPASLIILCCVRGFLQYFRDDP
jgi:hypothetical protein